MDFDFALCVDCAYIATYGDVPDDFSGDLRQVTGLFNRFAADRVVVLGDDEFFSWSPCDACKRPLAGTRIPGRFVVRDDDDPNGGDGADFDGADDGTIEVGGTTIHPGPRLGGWNRYAFVDVDDARVVAPDTYGGVALFAIMDDGETLCEACATDKANPVHIGGADDGWRFVAWETTGNTDERVQCVHCGAIVQEGEGE